MVGGSPSWIAWRVAQDTAPRPAQALAGVMPAAAVVTALWAAGVWTFCQPMAMCGAMVH